MTEKESDTKVLIPKTPATSSIEVKSEVVKGEYKEPINKEDNIHKILRSLQQEKQGIEWLLERCGLKFDKEVKLTIDGTKEEALNEKGEKERITIKVEGKDKKVFNCTIETNKSVSNPAESGGKVEVTSVKSPFDFQTADDKGKGNFWGEKIVYKDGHKSVKYHLDIDIKELPGEASEITKSSIFHSDIKHV